MADEPKRRLTGELAAIDGPVHLIDEHQTNLAAVLAAVLEKRHAIKKHLGKTSDEVEDEIARICALFTSANRRLATQLVMDAYAFNRYVKVAHTLSTDAPASSLETVVDAPEFAPKVTIPYAPKTPRPSVEIEISPETFDDLFDAANGKK